MTGSNDITAHQLDFFFVLVVQHAKRANGFSWACGASCLVESGQTPESSGDWLR